MERHLLKQFQEAKREGWLTQQAFKTLIGQLRAGNAEGASRGFEKLKRRAKKVG